MGGPQIFQGVVTAAKRMPKTITVTVSRRKVHPLIGKAQLKRTRMLTHDPHNMADVGDLVRIRNCAPVSAAKRHELLDILRKAQVVGGVREGVDVSESVGTLAEAEQEASSHGVTSEIPAPSASGSRAAASQ